MTPPIENKDRAGLPGRSRTKWHVALVSTPPSLIKEHLVSKVPARSSS